MEKNGTKGSYEQWGGSIGGPTGAFQTAVYGTDLYFTGTGGGGYGSAAPSTGEPWAYSGFAAAPPPPNPNGYVNSDPPFPAQGTHYSPFLGDAGAWGALVPPHDPRPAAPKDFYGATAGYRLPDSYGGSLHDGLHSLSLGPPPPSDPPAPKPLTWADKVKSTPKEAAKGLKKIPIGGLSSARSKDCPTSGGPTQAAPPRTQATVPIASAAPAPAARFLPGPPQPLIPPASLPEHHQPNLTQPPPSLFQHQPPPLHHQPQHNGWPPHLDTNAAHMHHHPPPMHHQPQPQHPHQHHHQHQHQQHHHQHHFNGDNRKVMQDMEPSMMLVAKGRRGEAQPRRGGVGIGGGIVGGMGGTPIRPPPHNHQHQHPPQAVQVFPETEDSNFLQRLRKETNPPEFGLTTKGARYFVIKSYSEDDVHRSIKYGIWASTDHGNKRLDSAFKEREGKGPIYLFFSVNASGHFCGVAQMMSAIDYSKQSAVWAQDKWKGLFKVKWLYVKDVPNGQLRQIRLENNENKPVTNSRDTQEVVGEKGRSVIRIIHAFRHTTSLFDDFAHYEKRQQEEDERKGKTDGAAE